MKYWIETDQLDEMLNSVNLQSIVIDASGAPTYKLVAAFDIGVPLERDILTGTQTQVENKYEELKGLLGTIPA